MALPRGHLNLSLAWASTWTQVDHPEEDQWHHVELFFTELRVRGEYGLTDWLAIDVLLPLRLVHVEFQLEDAARQPVAGPDIHHRTETLTGLGDLWLSLRAVQRLGRWAFAYRLGATLPLGATVANPFALGRLGLSHQHIQFGTGTVDPLIGVEIERAIGRFVLSGWMLGKLPLYENSHGYRAGTQVLGGFDLGSNLWTRAWSFTLGLFAYHEEAERWDGIVEYEGNLGRTDLILDTSIGWRFVGRWTIGVGARVPLYTHAVAGQLTTPAIGVVTLSRPVF